VDAPKPEPVVVTSAQGSTLVALTGDFDIQTVSEVTAEVDALLATTPSELVLDMAGVGFIDSSGIQLLLKIHSKVVRDGGGVVRVTQASEAARRALELCGLIEAFGVE
jgi:anti-anti-sigma factor